MTKCGCIGQLGRPTIAGYEVEIVFCPLHANAEVMLEALKAMVDMGKKGQQPSAERLSDYQELIAAAQEDL